MKIAAQLYTLREYLQRPEDVRTSLRRVRALGYEAVQLSGLGPIEADELVRIVRGEGLVAAATHVSWNELAGDLDALAERHHQLGCQHTAIAAMPKEFRHRNGYRQFGEQAAPIAQQLKKAGIFLSYHNHAFEFERFGEETGLDMLYRHASSALSAEIDVYWVQYGGGDPAQWIRKLSHRLPLVHLKDMTVVDGQPVMAEVGEGNLNWPNILDALETAGTRWYMVEQDVCRRDPFESLKISREHLREWGIS